MRRGGGGANRRDGKFTPPHPFTQVADRWASGGTPPSPIAINSAGMAPSSSLLASSLVGAAALVASLSSATTLTRVPLSDQAWVCLDGSPYSMYISPGTTVAGRSQFFLYMQGGGWCQDMAECQQRAATDLGSSKNWPASQDTGDAMSRDAAANPLMSAWTFVYLPYCDGGSFVGDAVVPPLHFNGLKIRQAVVASLRATANFTSATDLVVGGCSAGGLAAYLHVDWFAAQAGPTVKTRGLIDSGLFEDGNYTRDGKANYEFRMSQLYAMMNASAGIGAACNAALGYRCLFAFNLLPFIRTPVFATNSAYDATMGNGPCGRDSGIILDWANATSVNACGNYVRRQAQRLLSAPSAVFLDSCKHHCGEWGAISIAGLKSPAAVKIWYDQGSSALPNGGYIDQNATYPCDACCSGSK